MTPTANFDQVVSARFLTIVCHNRFPVFHAETQCQIMVKWIQDFRSRTGTRVFGYVIMPDHVHLVIWPPANLAVRLVIGQYKGRAAKEIIAMWPGRLPSQLETTGERNRQFKIWQSGCYDYSCRSKDEVIEKVNYCHKNPVTRGLVQETRGWTYSSFGCYEGLSKVPLVIDPIE